MSAEPPVTTDPSAPGAAPPPPGRAAATGGMIRSSMVYGGLTFVSRILGLVRDGVLAYTVGASATIAADAFFTAQSFPNLFRRIFAEGAFTAAFVPAYARTLEEKGQAEADRVAMDALAVLATITTVLAIVAMVAMPVLMHAINPGFRDDPEKFRLAVMLTQIAMPYLPAITLVALLSGVLNARGRFIVSALAPSLLNLFILAGLLVPADSPAEAARAAAWGIFFAGLGQLALLVWGVRRAGARLRLKRPRITPEIKALAALAVPGVIAGSATQVNVFISQALSSQVDGARAWLSTADRLYQLPLGLIGVAVGVALLPTLSRALGAGDRRGAQTAMDDALTFSMALTLPAAAALMAMPQLLIEGLFMRGAFNLFDARNTAAALFHYGWGVPAFVLMRVLTPAFFARRDTKGPMWFALASVVVNVALCLILFQIIGVPGLAVATSAASWLNVILMLATLARRRTWTPAPATLARLGKVLAASAVMAGAILALLAMRPTLEPLVGGKEILMLAVCAVGGGIYAVLLLALRAVTPAEIRAALRRRPAAASPGPLDGAA